VRFIASILAGLSQMGCPPGERRRASATRQKRPSTAPATSTSRITARARRRSFRRPVRTWAPSRRA